MEFYMKYFIFVLLFFITSHGALATMEIPSRIMWGDMIAAELNRFYLNQKPAGACPDGPDYICNGLMVTAFENGWDTYWMHPNDAKRLSFTYINKDIPITIYDNVGIILMPHKYVDLFVTQGLIRNPLKSNVRCVYPKDSYTTYRYDDGCGAIPDDVANTDKCQNIGITTSDQWIKKYNKNPNTLPHQAAFCGFGLEEYSNLMKREYFQASIEVQKYLSNTYPDMVSPWNEIVLSDWSEDRPKGIPLMAIYYVAEGSNLQWLNGIDANNTKRFFPGEQSKGIAKAHQKKYYESTGIFVPLVSISGNTEEISFKYADEDQSGDIPRKVNVLPE